MPCRISIHENSEGKVKVSVFNTSLFGKMLGGSVAKIMPSAAMEQWDIIRKVVA